MSRPSRSRPAGACGPAPGGVPRWRTGRSWWWLLALGLVVVGWWVTPSPVPLYDGVGQPDQPYVFVTGRAAQVQSRVPVVQGVNARGVSLSSAEVGPQVSVYVPDGALAAPGGSITVAVAPEAPQDQPPGGRIDGNVYVVTATDPAGPVTFTPRASLASVYLRATSARQPAPVMQYRAGPGQPWRSVQTAQSGTDVYVALMPGAGQYALAFLDSPGAAAPGGRGSGLTGLVGGLVVVLVVLLGVVLALRRRAG